MTTMLFMRAQPRPRLERRHSPANNHGDRAFHKQAPFRRWPATHLIWQAQGALAQHGHHQGSRPRPSDHPRRRLRGRVRARFEGHVIADSATPSPDRGGLSAGLLLSRASDVAMDVLRRAPTATPIAPTRATPAISRSEETASSARTPPGRTKNPIPPWRRSRAASPSTPMRSRSIRPRRRAASPSPDAVVLHTDDGAGVSQREPWPPTTKGPA